MLIVMLLKNKQTKTNGSSVSSVSNVSSVSSVSSISNVSGVSAFFNITFRIRDHTGLKYAADSSPQS